MNELLMPCTVICAHIGCDASMECKAKFRGGVGGLSSALSGRSTFNFVGYADTNLDWSLLVVMGGLGHGQFHCPKHITEDPV